ncbi:MAG: hypothetical protein ABSE73_06380 [Planctomycetota bacterium]
MDSRIPRITFCSTVAIACVTVFAADIRWEPLNEPGCGGWVTSLSVSPHDTRRVLVGGDMLGVGLSEFGERTFLLDSLPPFVKAGNPRQFILALVDELKAAGQGINALRLGEQTIAKTVCRHAVKANDPLSGRELENLVEDLRHCAMPYTCPHGLPTLIEMNFRELEKKFGRSQ